MKMPIHDHVGSLAGMEWTGSGADYRNRMEKDQYAAIVSWVRYEYEGLNLLRIDEVYDYDGDEVLEDPADGEDRWRPVNVYVHGPGTIGQVVRAHWYAYPEDGDSWCYEGNYYYAYDALGNALGVFQYGDFYRWETDAFGNDLPGGNQFLPMDEEAPKEHLTGKMFDDATGLYYFQARWLDPEVGRFVSRDPQRQGGPGGHHVFAQGNPLNYVDPTGRFWIPFISCGYFLATHGAWVGGCAAACGGDFDIFFACYMESVSTDPVEAITGAYAGTVCILSLLSELCDFHCNLHWDMPHPGRGQPQCHIHLRCWKGEEHHEDFLREGHGIPVPDAYCPFSGRDTVIPLF